ncbi:asparagine synthase (glutamine-hydrolyzing) [Cylindrospermopsis raciborskii]|uniref:asparagine synthase (glutamine-hydrolyzing) n=1 Tax=Cylindrospermopsis raciborskii TaxID=77022 RepID=UPI0022C02CB4|nr:asparagine synthase (glutamine-hydrolyzing) [Cylindrospermopsis raciborskii]MCZ2207537.1 asparagine synthase (glutamine-hydrolyzing) [Cylindrospermopsis raciborskii PAMP2011]
MCGITGFWNTSLEFDTNQLKSVASCMSDKLVHRGPDSGGVWADETSGVVLAHRRLAILDLSPEGHQPMSSANGRYVIVFNGEIYNFLDLRRELTSLGHTFRGTSDTEVMLASFIQWGIHTSLKKFNGMFAFALWDRQENLLHLGRDRLGEKPLYYGWVGKTLLFSSELKAIKTYPCFNPKINRDALALFFRHSYIPSPYSIYDEIYKLTPGTLLTWDGSSNCVNPTPYWSARVTTEFGVSHPFTGSDQEAVATMESLLLDAVKLRMVADVPLGAFLSGGIDSTTIVALMQSQTSLPVKTFTIGFHESAYNEAKHAKAIAQYLHTDHTELYITPDETMSVIPQLPTLYDEPFSDPSQVPTFLLSQITKRGVTVSLSGDAGDELFCGYNHYLLANKIWRSIGWMPMIFKQLAAKALNLLSVQLVNPIWGLRDLLPSHWQQSNIFKLHKLGEVISVSDSEKMYLELISNWKDPNSLVLGGLEPLTNMTNRECWADLSSFYHKMMFFDLIMYLPEDILVKVDRATMGVGLEARVPLLDHRVVEFAWRIPLSMKIRNGQGKWLLRQILYKYVPQHLVERPKMGFGVPIDKWLRGSLRDWAENLLDAGRLHQQGFLNSQLIRQKWKEHIAGDRNWQGHLWDVLMFQAWLEGNYFT